MQNLGFFSPASDNNALHLKEKFTDRQHLFCHSALNKIYKRHYKLFSIPSHILHRNLGFKKEIALLWCNVYRCFESVAQFSFFLYLPIIERLSFVL